MTLDEAIKIQENFLKTIPDTRYPNLFHAIQLGIEALKKIKEQRNLDGWLGTLGLPGETEE